jgi:hypothetical protein
MVAVFVCGREGVALGSTLICAVRVETAVRAAGTAGIVACSLVGEAAAWQALEVRMISNEERYLIFRLFNFSPI